MKPAFDEMHTPDHEIRAQYRIYQRWLDRQARETMQARREEAEMIFRRVGGRGRRSAPGSSRAW